MTNIKFKEFINSYSHEMALSASENDIKEQEKKLGIPFGSQYKDFLKEYGCLIIEHYEFYGICGDNSSIPSAIHATLQSRFHEKKFPNNLVVINDRGDGVLFCIDSSDNVYQYDCGNAKKIKKDFLTFITDKIKTL